MEHSCVAEYCANNCLLRAGGPESLLYQLTAAVLEELRPQDVSPVKKGRDGKYYWRNAPTDTPTVRLVVLDRPYSRANIEEFVLAKNGSDNSRMLLTHFSPADVQYMQQQVPAMRQFQLNPTRIRQEWVTIVSSDTLHQDYERQKKHLGRFEDVALSDAFFHRYGSTQVYCISGMLLSVDKRKALVTVDFGYGYDMCLYKKGPAGWYQEVVLYSLVE